jgi:uncharacterized protein (DUF1778 family)
MSHIISARAVSSIQRAETLQLSLDNFGSYDWPVTKTVRNCATKEEKQLIAAAVAHERLDVTSFIMRSALPEARKIVDRAERIVLSPRDTARVRMVEPRRGASALARCTSWTIR